ncbi:MAG TPA: isoprenylcysteine carboxylmethyltransferase family protein [Stellaceae bacterium]|nr:isoprenylcysteine carboxylmethyltransferase family protein [Stellaceae bacterium]
MHKIEMSLIGVLWLVWLAYWIIASFGVKETQRREPLGSRLSYVIPLMAGGILMSIPLPHPLSAPVVRWTLPLFPLGVAFVVAGLCFAVWARRHLAGYWSGTVTLKEGHELIRSGPYGWVRHPIYSGVLLALAGTVLALDEWRGIVALALMAGSFWRKILIEESWLSSAFPEQYPRYRDEVAALVPGVL